MHMFILYIRVYYKRIRGLCLEYCVFRTADNGVENNEGVLQDDLGISMLDI